MDNLETHYDLCIQGTGLVESIIACAAAKCGIKVIHLDKNDYYGGNYSSHSFDTFVQLGSESDADTTPSLMTIIGRAYELNSPSVESQTDKPTSQSHLRSELFNKAMKSSRYFSIDLTSKLLLCSGQSVDCFLKSRVSEYLEFKSIEALHYLSSPEEVLKVPCSKSDVFNSKLLTAMEKRLLTKFLQFVDDYGRESRGRSVATLNENDLAQGRSLHRPQNKSFDTSGFRIAEYEDKPFSEFMTFCKIPPSLQVIIVHALALFIRSSGTHEPLLTRTALSQLADVLNSLGRYGDTALLATVYGTAEIVQSFCRMAAVWGATYVLRESVASVVPYQPDESNQAECTAIAESATNDSCEDKKETAEQSTEIKEVVEDEGPNFPVTEPLEKRLRVTDGQNRSFTCHSFVSSVQDMSSVTLGELSSSQDSPNTKRAVFPVHSCLLTRVSVLSERALPLARNVLIVPPRTRGLDNTHAVMVTQQDSSMMVCAEGFYLLHVTTVAECDCEKHVVWDGSNSAGVEASSSISSQTEPEPWHVYAARKRADWNQLLDRVTQMVLSANTTEAPLEVHYVNAARPMFASGPSCAFTVPLASREHADVALTLPDHVFAVGEDGATYGLTVDDCLVQAERLFHHLFPDKEFMFPAKSALAESENSQFEEDFEEIQYYKSALGRTSDEQGEIGQSTSLTEGMESRTAANQDDIIHVPMVPRTDI